MKSNKTEQINKGGAAPLSRKAWANNRLAILDARLGKNAGAIRERRRLNQILNGKE